MNEAGSFDFAVPRESDFLAERAWAELGNGIPAIRILPTSLAPLPTMWAVYEEPAGLHPHLLSLQIVDNVFFVLRLVVQDRFLQQVAGQEELVCDEGSGSRRWQ